MFGYAKPCVFRHLSCSQALGVIKNQPMLQKIALVVFFALGLGLIVFGVAYLTATEFMPYHSDAIQKEWADLEANARGLFLGFLKGLGGGALIAGISTTAMSWLSLRGAVAPYSVLLPVVCVGYFSVLGYATITVSNLTPATPPVYLVVLAGGVSVIAASLLWIGRSLSK